MLVSLSVFSLLTSTTSGARSTTSYPDPLFPVPDPLQPIPDPNPLVQPPRIGPFGPQGPLGGRNPFDPFDPSNQEKFRGRPNQGVPRGGLRIFPANRWDHGNDFI